MIEEKEILAVETWRLTKFYGQLRAVDSLDLRVLCGEFHGLVGPNGAGKTTILEILCGILRPTYGTARIMGFDIEAQPEKAKRLIGYVPENPALYKSLTVGEFLEFMREVHSLPEDFWKTRGEKFMSMFELQGLRNEFVGALSKGWLQRVLLCEIMMREPSVFLLDEPFYALDPRGAQVLRRLLKERCESGAAVLMSTHVLEVAEKLCDTFTILNQGRTVARGSLKALRKKVRPNASLEDIFLYFTREDA